MLCLGWAGDTGGSAEIGRHAAAVSPRQPGQRLDPRGSDDFGRRPVLGGIQQSDPLQPARKTEPPEFIEPELAESWKWNDDYTRLTFKLRDGVKWHDGKPFSAADVKCTWDMLLGKSQDKLRLNPRKAWYRNLDEIVTEGNDTVTFVMKRPQPAFTMMLASAYGPVYPCHVPAAEMRNKPIGTGPFKFVEYKRNEYIKFARNPDYWKKGFPYLDAVEWTIIPNRSTQTLAFIAGQFGMTFPFEQTVQTMKDVQNQAPSAISNSIRRWSHSTSWSIATTRRSTIPTCVWR